MKSHEQIICHTSHCHYSPEDWGKIKDYCHNYENGGHIHKGKSPRVNSSYENFIEWITDGFGSGDIVRYGKTVGIVGDHLPGHLFLAAYFGLEDNLIIKELRVRDTERLHYANNEEVLKIRKALFEHGLEYNIKESSFSSICTPKKFLYYSYGDTCGGRTNMGIYCNTENNKYKFFIYLKDGKLLRDYAIDVNYTSLHPLTDKEKLKFNAALKRGKVVFDESRGGVVGLERKYWYLNDRFEVVLDKDNGAQRHADRHKVGNYFLSMEDALLFKTKINEIAKGKN